MRFRAAVAQFAPAKGEVETNLDRIAEIVHQAAALGCELVVFPETIVTGYFLEGGVLENSLSALDLLTALVRRTGGLNRPVDVLIGFYERADGHLYNSAGYLELGPTARCVHVYRKFFLPTYGVFDEERFVTRGRELGVFETRLGRMGVLICEDIWHSILPSLGAVAGAQVFLVPSASPARGFEGPQIGNLDRYARMLRAVSEEHGVFCLNAQLVGFEGGKGFVGGSSVVDPFGHLLAQAPIAVDALVTVEVDRNHVAIARAQTPLTADLQTAWSDLSRIASQL